RFTKELNAEKAFADKTAAKLGNGQFTENAPPEIVASEREKLDAARRRIEKLAIYIEDLI
ncbi:MAG: hypothetical protein LBR47_04440, partial [Spirochaetaceae bacterium]|nr:hypothetical protein [Spirochaetaceae bacterium]